MNEPAQRLLDHLEADHRRACRLQAGAVRAALLAAGLAALIVLFAADALLILTPAQRVAGAGAWLTVLVAGGILATRRARTPFHDEKAALRLERRGGLGRDEVVNAVDLGHGIRPGSSEALRAEVIARGESLARTIASTCPPDPARLRTARRAALAATALVLLGAVTQPRLVQQVGLRYLQPWGDHPPYCRLTFDVQQTPDPVPLNHAATVQVRIGGPGVPDRAEAVFPGGDTETRIPLWRLTPPDDASGTDFILKLPQVDVPREFFIDTPRGRSRRFALKVSTQPLLKEASLRIEPPAYTGRPATEQRIVSPNLSALRGSRVELVVAANVALGASPLQWDSPERHRAGNPVMLQPDPQRATRVIGAWTAEVSDSFEVVLTGTDGETAAVPMIGHFEVVEDQPPSVRITSPEERIIAVEDWMVDISVSASDDVRVERLERSVLLGTSAERRELPLPPDRADPAVAQAVFPLDLAALGAVAGDRVRYFATALDNHPNPPQSADSAVHVIDVVSREDYEAIMRANYLLADWLDEISSHLSTLHRLADAKQDALDTLERLMERAAADPELDLSAEIEAALAQLDRLREDLDHFAAELLARADMEPLYDWEAPYKDWLRRTAEQLAAQRDAAGTVRDALRPENLGPGSSLDAAREAFAALEAPFGGLPSDPVDLGEEWGDMLDAMRLLEATQRLRELVGAQRDLADRMTAASERDTDRPETREMLRRLGAEQDALREDLHDIQRNLREAADGLSDQYAELAEQTRSLADALDELDVAADQQTAVREANRFQTAAAAAASEQAAAKLESLSGDCQGQCDSAGQCLADLFHLTPPSLHPSMEAALQAALTAVPGPSLGRIGVQGAGNAGLLSTVGMMGPQYPMRGQSVSMRGAALAGHGNSGGQALGADAPATAEAVNPEPSGETLRAAPQLRLIPARYRRMAAAYFQRLNEDETATPREAKP